MRTSMSIREGGAPTVAGFLAPRWRDAQRASLGPSWSRPADLGRAYIA